MNKLLIASSNKHKIEELKHILKNTGIIVISPDEVGGIPDVEETGLTFEENASLKAVQISKLKGCHVFADDSGLEVEALDWRPGIYSARYAGPEATDRDRIEKLLKELADKSNRNARFVCVIAISDKDGSVTTYRGEVYGQILYSAKGTAGFGYDPVFMPTGYNKTFAELCSDEKNKISHRAMAMLKALPELKSLKNK